MCNKGTIKFRSETHNADNINYHLSTTVVYSSSTWDSDETNYNKADNRHLSADDTQYVRVLSTNVGIKKRSFFILSTFVICLPTYILIITFIKAVEPGYLLGDKNSDNL